MYFFTLVVKGLSSDRFLHACEIMYFYTPRQFLFDVIKYVILPINHIGI